MLCGDIEFFNRYCTRQRNLSGVLFTESRENMIRSKSTPLDLEQLSFFQGFTPIEVSQIIQSLNGLIKHVPKSNYVYQSGECTRTLGLLLTGTAQIIQEDVLGERSIIANLERGSILSANILSSDYRKNTVSCLTTSDSEVLLLPMENGVLENDLAAYPFMGKLMYNLIACMAKHNHLLLEKNQVLSYRSTRSKIMAYLVQEAAKQHSKTVTLPLNRTQLGDYLSVDRSSMTRELMKMRREGLIDFQKNVFTIMFDMEEFRKE